MNQLTKRASVAFLSTLGLAGFTTSCHLRDGTLPSRDQQPTATTPATLPTSSFAFTETKVTLKNGVVGILTRPIGIEKVPAVLMLHGFGSQKDEVGGMFKRTAAELAAQGIASLRIDFRGWGESAGAMEKCTIRGQVDDANVAYEYLAAQAFVDSGSIGVLGFSLGGGVAVVSAGAYPLRFKSMVLWSSVGDFQSDFTSSFGEENFKKAAADGIVTIDLGWRSVTLEKEFFSSLREFSLQDEIKKYPGSFFAVAGSKDFAAAYVETYISGVKSKEKESWIIEGGDHILQGLSNDQTMVKRLIARTVHRFGTTLR